MNLKTKLHPSAATQSDQTPSKSISVQESPVLDPPPTLAKNDLNLVWLDCEMTGLEPDPHLRGKTPHPGDRIIEIAVIVTNADLSIRVEGPVLVIHQSEDLLGRMDNWNKGTHGKSGLIDKVKASTVSEAQAEAEVLAFLSRCVSKATSPLCGNTVGQDRRFLKLYMPKLEAFFHYRNLDVSTLKELARRWKPAAFNAFKKQQKHTALADVHESIDELVHYRNTFLNLT
jgi:oligoribonuclease